MKINHEQVRRAVCEAGLRLSAEGLVARTWGNISIRIDGRTMAVTPSGIMYEDIKPEHIAIMDIFTGKWESTVRPSGERKLHAAVYRARPEAGAVIHTHQLNASVCAAARVNLEVKDPEAAAVLCTDKILCGGYGLPGTGRLTRETVKAIGRGMCALMANHGAVCLGRDIDEAFAVSRALEDACISFIAAGIAAVSGKQNMSHEDVCGLYLQTRTKH